MEQLFAWYNLIFYIPILGGILMAVGSAMGLGGGDAGDDMDHDVAHDVADDVGHDLAGDHHVGGDHDTDGGKIIHAWDDAHHQPGFVFGVFSILGVGRAPLTVILMLAGLTFGGTGVILNGILAPILVSPWVYVWVSIAGATASMVTLTGMSARAIARLIPTSETYLVKRQDLVGRTGKLVLDATPDSGVLQAYDRERNLHQVTCRTREGRIPSGCEVLVVDYLAEESTYIVEVNPLVPPREAR